MNRSLQHVFSAVPRADIQRSVFNRDHTLKTAFDSGYLVPIYVDEALPGDTFSLDLSLFGRLSTMAVPVMDNLYIETFFFAVPNRLVWDNWQKFCGEQENPGDSTDYVVPVLASGVYGVGSLSDYFGLPVFPRLRNVSALWHRAYNLIWNEWFRDENLQQRAVVPKGDGPDQASYYPLRKRRKTKDYFTGALPWPQKGPGVQVPIGQSAPVYGDGLSLALKTNLAFRSLSGSGLETLGMRTAKHDGTALPDGYPRLLDGNFSGTTYEHTPEATGGLYTSSGIPTKEQLGSASSGLVADLTQATATTINQLREAFQIQRMYERDAVGGTRYIELLEAHFGVQSPDARLQRPEYLGGSSSRILVHPVAQQSATDSTSPQANLAAFATASDTQHIFTKSFVEHSLIIGLVNVRADLNYQQGTPRMFSRRTRFDYYWPALAHLGEQAILNKEIFTADDGSPELIDQDNAAFGFQERWAEYRYKPSMITGKMRSGVSGSLDVWHLAQYFTSLPALNSSFVEENVPLDRVVAVTNEPQIILDASFGLKCARPMPVYSVPGLIDHF